MAFRGITFSGQNVTPKNDGALYNAHYGDGILEGCSMAISGDDLVIQSGHIIACGRVCQVDGATPVDLSGRTLQTGYIQIILNYDLTQGEGQQWYTTFVESATTTFPALTQEDINTPSGTLYQLQLAVVQISGGNLTNITAKMGQSGTRVISETGAYVENVIEDEFSNVRTVKADGTHAGGFSVSGAGNYTNVWNENGDIVLRPNGIASNVGEVKLLNSGQLVGGHLYTIHDTSSQRAVGAGTYATVATLSLDTTGIYLIDCYVSFQANSNGETVKRIGIANVSNSLGIRTTDYYSGTTEIRSYHFTCIQIPTQVLNYINFYNGTIAGTIREVYCRVLRIA